MDETCPLGLHTVLDGCDFLFCGLASIVAMYFVQLYLFLVLQLFWLSVKQKEHVTVRKTHDKKDRT